MVQIMFPWRVEIWLVTISVSRSLPNRQSEQITPCSTPTHLILHFRLIVFILGAIVMLVVFTASWYVRWILSIFIVVDFVGIVFRSLL